MYFKKRKHAGGSPSLAREGLLWKSGKNGLMVEKMVLGLIAAGQVDRRKEFSVLL